MGIDGSGLLAVGRDFVYETEANIRRLSMLRADFQVRPPRSQPPGVGSRRLSGGYGINPTSRKPLPRKSSYYLSRARVVPFSFEESWP